MCGRTRCTLGAGDITRACHLTNRVSVQLVDFDRYRPSYNVSPGSYMPVIRREGGPYGCDIALHAMKWGLIPSFTKKDEKPDHFRMFNARSESVSEKASFRRLIPKNRCLVAVEGFYEWKKDGSRKQPYYVHFQDGRPLVFAALYDTWKNPEGEDLYTFTILTTSSSKALSWLHDRMPVILGDGASTDIWLNGSASIKLDSLLKPYEGPDLAWYAVTPAMGKVSFDGPECIKEIYSRTEEKPISKFFSKAGADKSKDLKIPVKGAIDESFKTTVKEEPETEAVLEPRPTYTTQKSDLKDVKREFSDQSPDADEKKHGIKREAEQNELEAEEQSPASASKKKSKSDTKSTGGGDKQSTLFSFFGKS